MKKQKHTYQHIPFRRTSHPCKSVPIWWRVYRSLFSLFLSHSRFFFFLLLFLSLSLLLVLSLVVVVGVTRLKETPPLIPPYLGSVATHLCLWSPAISRLWMASKKDTFTPLKTWREGIFFFSFSIFCLSVYLKHIDLSQGYIFLIHEWTRFLLHVSIHSSVSRIVYFF